MSAILTKAVLAVIGGGMLATTGVAQWSATPSPQASTTVQAVYQAQVMTAPGPARGSAVSSAVSLGHPGSGTTTGSTTVQAVYQAQVTTAPGPARGSAVSSAASTTQKSALSDSTQGSLVSTGANGGMNLHVELHVQSSAKTR